MNIEEFKAGLKKQGIGPGARWQKADFHVHLPGSSDYEYRGADAMEQLGAALSAGDYRFAVVLKHEQFPTRSELDALSAHCPKTRLIPGAEINVFVDALEKKVGKDYFFHCVVAVDPDQADPAFIMTNAKRHLTLRGSDYPSGFVSSIVDVAGFFRKEGALFIPAHLHQGKSPDNSRSIDDVYNDDAFLSFVRAGCFDALEVRDVKTASFFDGEHKTADQTSIPKSICVASSDAHHHEHIKNRNRFTWLRVEDNTYGELAAALSFRHRVSLAPPATGHPRVVGMHVVGAFLPEKWVSLNEGLNALIGSKGSGKTALLECLRFGLNTLVPSDRADSVTRHITHVLGPAGYVECLVERGDGSEVLITRRADSRDRITVTDATGAIQSRTTSQGQPFPISILGWHEIEAVADKPQARIELLDRTGDPAVVTGHMERIRGKIEHARDQFQSLQPQIKRLDGALKHLWELQRKRAALARLKEGEMLALQNQYDWFLQTEQQLQLLKSAAATRHGAVPTAYRNSLRFEVSPVPNDDAVASAKDRLGALSDALAAVSGAETAAVNETQTKIAGVQDAVTLAVNALSAAFSEFREKVYTPKVNQLPPADREILTKQILVLEETKQLPTVLQQCEQMLNSVRASAVELRDICRDVCSERDKIAAYREQLVTALNADLNKTVQLKFQRNSNRDSRTQFQSKSGQEGANLANWLDQTYGQGGSYQSLAALFDQLANVGLEQAMWKVNGLIWDLKMVEFFSVLDDDDVELSLAVGKAGYVPLPNLSAGQRCVAVFPLLLRNAKAPLVIDQPEDNLDNRYIADTVAPDLLRRKSHQQFLVTSHNANLVVLTDADLVVHVDSDGKTCKFPTSGFLACPASRIKQAVLDVLDGGEAALAARQRKYSARRSVG